MKDYFNYDRLNDIDFKYIQKKNRKQSKKYFDNLIAFDIETSNGYMQQELRGATRLAHRDLLDVQTNNVIAYDPQAYLNDSSVYDNAVKISLMYVWQIAIDDGDIHVFMGRTYDDFIVFLQLLSAKVSEVINDKITITIYIHNFGFEFQHLRNCLDDYFKKEDVVFARQARKPLKAAFEFDNDITIEFRDSLVLTQKSLDQWCIDENLPVKKLHEPKGYYDAIRTPETPLTDDEYAYQENDVVSMIYGLRKYKEKYGTIHNIPLTQTGIVRRECKAVLKQNKLWLESQKRATENMSQECYHNLVSAYAGGWTHANSHYVDKVVTKGRAFDFASSYPAVMCMFSYPCDEWKQVPRSEYDTYLKINPRDYLRSHCYFIHVRIKNLKAKTQNTFWSSSRGDNDWVKSLNQNNFQADNGKIYYAEEFSGYLTDLDWNVFKKAYTMESYVIDDMWVAPASPLPRELITVILQHYAYKTTLKGNDAMASKYTESKQFINSIYGMSVTRVIADSINYTGDWEVDRLDTEAKYEEKRDDASSTFLAYAVGVWVAAYARNNLWSLILHLDHHVVYGDTDSLKGPFDAHDISIINAYNEWIRVRQQMVIKHMNLAADAFTPKTPKGVEKCLGVFEEEDAWEQFKTLGAKRYASAYLTPDNTLDVHLTVAGLPKMAGKKITNINDFNDHTYWNATESCKKTHSYNDNQPSVVWTDRLGDSYESHDKYGICICPTSFDMSMTPEFTEFVSMIQGNVTKRSNNILL